MPSVISTTAGNESILDTSITEAPMVAVWNMDLNINRKSNWLDLALVLIKRGESQKVYLRFESPISIRQLPSLPFEGFKLTQRRFCGEIITIYNPKIWLSAVFGFTFNLLHASLCQGQISVGVRLVLEPDSPPLVGVATSSIWLR